MVKESTAAAEEAERKYEEVWMSRMDESKPWIWSENLYSAIIIKLWVNLLHKTYVVVRSTVVHKPID